MAQDTMTPVEAGAYLNLSPGSVLRKARLGEVPAAKTGRKWLFRRSDLDAWLSAGGTLATRIEDDGLAALMNERMADPANH